MMLGVGMECLLEPTGKSDHSTCNPKPASCAAGASLLLLHGQRGML